MTMKDLDNVLASAKQQLARVLGPERAADIVAKTYRAAGLKAVTTAAELLIYADAMVGEGGFVEVVGRGLKVEALLRGARTSTSAASHGAARAR